MASAIPGPGLGIRVLEILPKKTEIVRESDYILREEIESWIAEGNLAVFSQFPGIRSVGVMGMDELMTTLLVSVQ